MKTVNCCKTEPSFPLWHLVKLVGTKTTNYN
jgi:hypothetical protein